MVQSRNQDVCDHHDGVSRQRLSALYVLRLWHDRPFSKAASPWSLSALRIPDGGLSYMRWKRHSFPPGHCEQTKQAPRGGRELSLRRFACAMTRVGKTSVPRGVRRVVAFDNHKSAIACPSRRRLHLGIYGEW